jgi:hypothetical protein
LDLDEEEVERRVRLRMERQDILAKESGLELWVVLDEAALRRMNGNSRPADALDVDLVRMQTHCRSTERDPELRRPMTHKRHRSPKL